VPDPEDLDLRLSRLRTMPSAALPGAAAARSRGAARTRRSRTVLGGAGAALVLLTGLAVAGGGGTRDAVAPPAGGVRSPAPQEGLAGSLLDVAYVQAVLPGAWQVRATDDLPFPVLPERCGDNAVARATQTALVFLNGPQDQVVGHQLLAFSTAQDAAREFSQLADAVTSGGCGAGYATYEGGIALPGSGETRFYGRRLSPDGDAPFALERVGAVLSVVALSPGRFQDLPPLADAAADALQGGGPVPPDSQPGRGLLTPADVARIEPVEWTQMVLDDRALLAPCEGRTDYPRFEEVVGVDLRSQPNGTGPFALQGDSTSMYQQVFRYSSSAVAQQALRAHRAAVEACPRERTRSDTPAGEVVADRTYEVVDAPGDALLVRVGVGCPGCQPAFSYTAVAQVGNRLSVLVVNTPQEGGPSLGTALTYLEVALERLRQVAD